MKRPGNVKSWFEDHGTDGLFQFERQKRPEVYKFTGTYKLSCGTTCGMMYQASHVATFDRGVLVPNLAANTLWVEEDRRIKTVHQPQED